jgi:hypothetical protein
MTLTRQSKFGLWVLAAVIIGAAAFFVGSSLRPGEEPHFIFDTGAPAYGEPSGVAATSTGGFTGFGETDGSRSRVVFSGRIVEISGSSVTLESLHGQRTALQFAGSPPLFRIDAADSADLRPGSQVALRLNEAGDTVEGILVLSGQ